MNRDEFREIKKGDIVISVSGGNVTGVPTSTPTRKVRCKVTRVEGDRVYTECLLENHYKGTVFYFDYPWFAAGYCELETPIAKAYVLIEVSMGGSLTTQAIPASEFDPKKHKKFTF